MVVVGGGQMLPPFSSQPSQVAIVGGTVHAAKNTIIDMTDAEIGFAAQFRGATIHAMGGSTTKLHGATTVSGSLVAGSTARVARVADPDNAQKWAWLLRCALADPDTVNAGSRRAEICYTELVSTVTQTYGFCLRAPSYAGHSDQFIIAQIHGGNGSSLIRPWLGIYIIGNALNIVLRSDETIVATAVVPHVADVWRKFVVVAKKHTPSGYISIMIDGVQVMTYAGAVAESNNSLRSYWKIGTYEWDAPTQWDVAFPVREVFAKGIYTASGDASVDMLHFLDEI